MILDLLSLQWISGGRGMMERFKVELVVFLILAIFVHGCKDTQTSPPSREGASVLRIAVGRDLYDGPDSRSFIHGSLNAWESLTYLNEKLQPKEWIAESWQMAEGGRKWVFQLRDGVVWHDGTSLSQDMVITNILRYKNHPKYDPHGLYRDLLSVQPIGKRGVAFLLKQPHPNFPAAINYFGSALFHPECFNGKGQFIKFIGSGPYRFERNKDGVIRLHAHTAYWQGQPPFEAIEFWNIPDAVTRLNALKTGQVDAIADVGAILPHQLLELSKTKHLLIKNTTVATTHFLLFNTQCLPFNDLSARAWLSATLDRFRIARHILGEAGIPADSLWTPLAADWYEKVFPQNLSGSTSPQFPQETPVSILLHGGTLQRWPYKDIAEMIHSYLNRAGLKATIRIEEAGSFKESLKRGNFNLALHPFTLMTGDPDIFFTWLMTVSPSVLGAESKAIELWASKARHEMNKEERRRIYASLQKWVAERSLLLPLYHDIVFYAHRESLQGLSLDPFFRPNLMAVRMNTNLQPQ